MAIPKEWKWCTAPINTDGAAALIRSVDAVIEALKSIPPEYGSPSANRHERRQEASRKHQRAALHGAGDQKRIAVERRSE